MVLHRPVELAAVTGKVGTRADLTPIRRLRFLKSAAVSLQELQIHFVALGVPTHDTPQCCASAHVWRNSVEKCTAYYPWNPSERGSVRHRRSKPAPPTRTRHCDSAIAPLRFLEFGAWWRSLKRTGYLIHYCMGLAMKDTASSKRQVRRRLHITGRYFGL